MNNTAVTFQCQCCNHVWTLAGAEIVGRFDRCVVGDMAGGSLLCQRDPITTEGGCGMSLAKVIAVETDEARAVEGE